MGFRGLEVRQVDGQRNQVLPSLCERSLGYSQLLPIVLLFTPNALDVTLDFSVIALIRANHRPNFGFQVDRVAVQSLVRELFLRQS